MGKRGPPPKSPELESAQGFPGRRKGRTKKEIAAREEREKPDADLQDEARDSGFVPGPPGFLTKTARRIWAELFSDPGTRLWFKVSDHRLIARYASLAAIMEATLRRPPSPTYEVVKETGGDADGNGPKLRTVLIKRNPAYDQMLATMREMRAIEDQIAASPKARLGYERGLGAGAGGKVGKPDMQPAGPSKPPSGGPLGALKPTSKLN